ncbi:MAG TPA: tetratricopeptide repeat protein [Gammaproteobacteria bacterium]|nr:tetratricopeptide repeat protein [Gammaproteobacteria bacterium]
MRRARDALAGARDFDAALNPAETVVARQDQTQRDADYAKDLTVLALIQIELKRLDPAESNLLKAIEIVEKAEGEFSISLVEPYRGLGRAYIKEARYPQAITVLEQAQNVSQRNLGLFNVEQSGVIDDLTTAYLGLGDTVEARRMQLERLDNAVKRFGANDPRVFPFRYQLADYYQRSRLTESAREQYAQVLKSQESQLAPNDPQLMNPLRQLAKIDLLTTQGETAEAHDRLEAVLEQNPDADPLERGLSLAALGDWAIVTGNAEDARLYYKQAWDAIAAKPDADVQNLFAKPALLDFVAPLDAVDRGERSRRPYAWAQIEARFDVAADGRTFNVSLVGREAPLSPIESRFARRLRETHFRPRLVDGEPVATSGVRFTHLFRYYVSKEEAEQGSDDGN